MLLNIHSVYLTSSTLDIVHVMESCGLSYSFTKVIEATDTDKYGKKTSFVPYNREPVMMLKLDPAFDQLLLYSECEDLEHRHRAVCPEMRQVIYGEQRKYSIQLKVGGVLLVFSAADCFVLYLFRFLELI